jgi:predicted unusual protein kinase regulating ubiquinone biosynthesis (AarF/ABC1/UbiB family)
MTGSSFLSKGWQRHWGFSAHLARFILKGFAGRLFPEEIQAFLGEIKGPFVKIAQVASMIPGFLPEEYAAALGALCSHAPSMRWPFVKRCLQKELGVSWKDSFSSFDTHASFAASLGQVHQGVLSDGQKIACKIQYPGIDQALEDDLRYLDFFCQFYQKYFKALDLTELQKEWKQQLRQELDYTAEEKHMRWFQIAFSSFENVHVPQAFHNLSTGKVLTMQWLEGSPFQSAFVWPQNQRNHLGKLLFSAFYRPFFEYGIMHSDPHYGNYTVSGNRLNLLDFGSIKIFFPQFIQSVLDLYNALLSNHLHLLEEIYFSWGFKNLNAKIIDLLTQWARVLMGPVLRSGYGPITVSVSQMQKLASYLHQELRREGGVCPPPEFLWLDRCAVAVGSALMNLGACADWQSEFQAHGSLFEREKTTLRQSQLS